MSAIGQSHKGNDPDDERLLANGGPHGLFRGLYRAHGQNIHVNRQADPDQEVPITIAEAFSTGPRPELMRIH